MTSKVVYTFTPNLRSHFVADDGRDFDLPAFWHWVDEQVPRGRFLQTGCVNRRHCRMLWRWLGRTDAVPNKLDILLSREDLERIFPGIDWNWTTPP